MLLRFCYEIFWKEHRNENKARWVKWSWLWVNLSHDKTWLITWKISPKNVFNFSYFSRLLVSFLLTPPSNAGFAEWSFNFRGRVAWVTSHVMFSVPLHTLCTRLTRHISRSIWRFFAVITFTASFHFQSRLFIPRPILCFDFLLLATYKHNKANEALREKMWCYTRRRDASHEDVYCNFNTRF